MSYGLLLERLVPFLVIWQCCTKVLPLLMIDLGIPTLLPVEDDTMLMKMYICLKSLFASYLHFQVNPTYGISSRGSPTLAKDVDENWPCFELM